MAYPYFSRVLTASDTDCDGVALRVDRDYDLEWLRPNHILNGGFEKGLPGDMDQWSEDAGADYLAIITTGAHTGSRCLQVTANAQGQSCILRSTHQAPIRVRRDYAMVARTYIMRCYARGHSINFSLVFSLGADWYDEDGAFISTSWGDDHTATIAGWAQYESELTPPNNANYAYFKIRNQTDDQGFGYIDEVEAFPSLDVRTWTNSGWTTDDPTFTPLHADDVETLTFDRMPHLGSAMGSDDPVVRYERQDGYTRERRLRLPRQTITLLFERLYAGYGEQLLRWHAKTRAASFSYFDTYGSEYTVRWKGVYGVPWKITADLCAPPVIILAKDLP